MPLYRQLFLMDHTDAIRMSVVRLKRMFVLIFFFILFVCVSMCFFPLTLHYITYSYGMI